MSLDVAKELARLESMSVGQLHERYAAVFSEPARSRHRQYLIRRIAWRLQANAEGGLSERALWRAAELADEGYVRVTPPKRATTAAFQPPGPTDAVRVAVATDPRLPPPGGAITRKYKGQTVSVTVLPDGFEYDGHRSEVYEGEHQAIVPEDLFRRVLAQLQHNGRSGGAEVRNHHGALLRGLLHCKACGRVMTHTFTSRGNKRYRYYTCTKAIKNGWDNCPTKSLPAGEIERVVLDQIRCIGSDPQLLRDTLAEAQGHVQSRLERVAVERAGVERSLARTHAEIRRLAAASVPATAVTDRIFAVEGLFGQARVRLDAGYHIDESHSAIVVDATTEVGAAAVRVFTSLLLHEFGADSFHVRRAEPAMPATVEGKAA